MAVSKIPQNILKHTNIVIDPNNSFSFSYSSRFLAFGSVNAAHGFAYIGYQTNYTVLKEEAGVSIAISNGTATITNASTYGFRIAIIAD